MYCVFALVVSLVFDALCPSAAQARRTDSESAGRRQKKAQAEPAAVAPRLVEADDQEIVARVERGFQHADPESILLAFRYFGGQEQEIMRQEAIRLFLRAFFDQFGPASAFGPILRPKEELGLGVVHSAEEAQWQTTACELRKYEFTTACGRVGGLGVKLVLCREADQVWLKDLSLLLGDPNNEARAKSERFQNALKTRYAALLSPPTPTKTAAAAPPALIGSGSSAIAAGAALAPLAPPFGGPLSDMFRTIGAVTSSVVVFVLALALLCYMFFALCLYCIARKLDVPTAWLAWAPFANSIVMVAAARKPFWWNALLLFPLLGWLPIPGVLYLVWIVGLVDVVLLALVWMSICVRLSSPAWAGLFILAPFANLMLPAFLAFKPERFAPLFFLKRTLAAWLLVYLGLVAGLWFLVSWNLSSAISTIGAELVKDFPTASAPPVPSRPLPPSPRPLPAQNTGPSAPPSQAAPPAPMLPDPMPVTPVGKSAMPPDLASLGQAEYEALFVAPAPAFGNEAAGRPSAVSGPANILLHTFWPDDKSPHFWLKVRLPAFPSLQHFKSGAIFIDHVRNTAGQDLYDKDNQFETANFRDLNFYRHEGQPSYLEGLRDVHLKPGAKEEEVKKIEGAVLVLLPVAVKNVIVGRKNLGAPVAVGDLQFTLRKISGKQAELEVSGPIDRHVATLGIDAAGREIERTQYSAWTENDAKKNYTYGFKTDINELKVLVAEKIVEKRIPFALERK